MTQDAGEWTVGRLLTWTTDFLRQRGTENPRLDAEVLLAAALDCERIQLYATFGETVAEDDRSAFREYVKRRSGGEPVAYLVGHREFYSLNLRVTRDVLIPRPETELLVMTALDLLNDHVPADTTAKVIDVGTGSGAIAVAIARYSERTRLLALDLSEAALEVARGNAVEHEVTERIEFQQGDLLEGVPAEPIWDLIISNPPYVSTSELETLNSEVRDFEPHLALVAGPDGDEVIRRLVPQAAQRLVPGGWLLLEISPMLASAVTELVGSDGHYEQPQTIKDSAGHARVIMARRKTD